MSDEFLAALRRAVGPMTRQIRGMLSRCIITMINDATPLQEVQVSLLAMPRPEGGMGKEVADGIEVLRQYGVAAHPHPGAEGVYLSVGGVRTHGLVIAVEDRRYRLTGLAEGETALYDDLGHRVHLTRTGIVIDGATHQVTVTNTPKVRLETPRLEVTGEILDRCDTTGRTMADMRSIHNLHTHGGVSSGGGDTAKPNQQE